MIVRLACLLIVLVAGPAMAQPYEPPISIPGSGPDEPELPPGPPPEQLFISPAGEPFRAAPGEPYPVVAWFNRADANHDGVLTPAEFAADALAFFDVLDADKDRVVDGFENADYEREVAPEITGILRRRDPEMAGGGPPQALPPSRAEQIYGRPSLLSPGGPRRSGPPRQGAAQYGLLNEPHPVRGADADLDQRVSRLEASNAAAMRFRLLDEDGDGRVALVDLPRTQVQMMRDGPAPGGRRKPPAKRVQLRLQPPAVNAIPFSGFAANRRHESP